MRQWLDSILAELKLSADDRSLFYRLLAEQLDSGIALGKALHSIAAAALPKPVTALARTCEIAVEEGRTLASGMAESGSIPSVDMAFINSAQRHDALPAVLSQMIGRGQSEQTLTGIFTANAYWLMIFMLLMLVLYNGDMVIAPFLNVSPAAGETPLARAVDFVQAWGLSIAVAVVTLVLLVTWGRQSWHGPGRRLLAGLATEYERRIAIRICDMAGLLLPTGLEHAELLRIAQETAHSGYARERCGEAADKLNQGQALPVALKDTLFDDTALAVLDQLAPAGDPEKFGPAFTAVGRILRTFQANFHRRATRVVFLLVLLADAGGILIVVTGVIGMVSMMQATIAL